MCIIYYIKYLFNIINICLILIRGVSGIRDKTLIINLPGSPKAAKECLSVIAPAIPHAVDLIRDNKEKIKNMHGNMQNNIVAEKQDKISVRNILFIE